MPQGFVASLNRPGGNVTGLTNISRQVVPKRLEPLKETVPGLARVAVIWNPGNPAKPIEFADLQSAAATLRIDLRSLEVRSPGDVEQALGTAAREGAEGLLALGDSLTVGQIPRIANAVQANPLPAIHEVRAFPAAGGLMSHGASLPDQWRRGAAYVDKILKGAKPADLPVEQPTRFDSVINLQTARVLGLTMPESVLQQATELIQ